jgi:hypothetical protein
MTRLLFLLITLVFSSGAAACEFFWHHYGPDSISNRLDKTISAHITDEYCQRFTEKNELVIELTSYALSNGSGCVGHASVSMRAKHSKIQQAMAYTGVQVDHACHTQGGADMLAVKAAEGAVDNLMSDLDAYKETK